MATGLRIRQKRELHIGQWLFWLILVGLLVGCLWIGYRYYTTGETPIPVPIARANPAVEENEITSQKKEEYTVPPTHPRYISVPSLSVENARVLKMGVKKNGELDTPVNIHDSGWYEKSSLPGSGYGAVLMDGHNGGPTKGGIFENLPNMKIGAAITIERGDGNKVNYKVAETKTYTLDELNNGGMQEMMKSVEPSKEGLNIISCTGNWVPRMQTYDKRIVVRAVVSD